MAPQKELKLESQGYATDYFVSVSTRNLPFKVIKRFGSFVPVTTLKRSPYPLSIFKLQEHLPHNHEYAHAWL